MQAIAVQHRPTPSGSSALSQAHGVRSGLGAWWGETSENPPRWQFTTNARDAEAYLPKRFQRIPLWPESATVTPLFTLPFGLHRSRWRAPGPRGTGNVRRAAIASAGTSPFSK